MPLRAWGLFFLLLAIASSLLRADHLLFIENHLASPRKTGLSDLSEKLLPEHSFYLPHLLWAVAQTSWPLQMPFINDGEYAVL